MLLPIAVAIGARQALCFVYALTVTPFGGREEAVLVRVPQGAGAAEALRALERAGVLADARSALGLLVGSGHARDVKAGEYRFEWGPFPAGGATHAGARRRVRPS